MVCVVVVFVLFLCFLFFFQAEDGIRDSPVTGVQTCALPISERQAALSLRMYQQGNLLYWTSLTALIVGAVVQREVLERRYDDGPEFLAAELAYPQALRRGVLSVASFVVGVRWLASDATVSFPPSKIVEEGTRTTDLTGFVIGCAFFLSAWAAYGVYRTILAARSEPKVKDVL